MCIVYDKIVKKKKKIVKKKILLNQYSYTHTHIRPTNYLIVMPEYDTHDPRHRYVQIGIIIDEIVRIVQLKNCNDEYVFNRHMAEKYIRKWYAELCMCQAVTQRDRIQTAWSHYDYAVIKAWTKQEKYANPQELV